MAGSSSEKDWQIGLTCIAQRAKHILESNQWTDCVFRVGPETNQQTVKAHKLVLAMASPVFEAMFYGGMVDKDNKPIEILDIQPEAFKALLHYIYTDEVKVNSFDQVCEICYAGKKYMITPLVEKCAKYLWQDLHPGNACRAYEFAKLFEEPDLVKTCMQIITTKTESVMREPSFEELERVTLITLLEQDELAASELSLWEGCVRWAEQECIRQSLEPTPANQRMVLGDAFYLIRMMALTPTEFANGPASSRMLTQEESFSILMNISSPDVTPMPPRFSTRRARKVPASGPSYNPKRLSHENSGPGAHSHIPASIMGQLECTRGFHIERQYYNAHVADCSTTFSVDHNVCILGIEVPSQIYGGSEVTASNFGFKHNPSWPSLVPNAGAGLMYPELIYTFLQDSDGSRLTYTHFTSRVNWDDTMEVMFNRPVLIQRGKSYKIVVVLNKYGQYPLYRTEETVTVDGTTFTFEKDPVRDTKDGLIRTIFFYNSTPRIPRSCIC